ncbi:DUF1837 domain-containing protein [Undibacterium seohonense]|uniref:DUF1837 domain-containing protein n=1 Tax=Undibacterium seohonense TaxID=1344950 RepID=A0ABR6X8X8_9BURK|nr:DUF1837 domain-containing protein [Undibacterium seohonense]MBC3809265.1 DUF1837 domain-containing protein [Undibacterium seohonense]
MQEDKIQLLKDAIDELLVESDLDSVISFACDNVLENGVTHPRVYLLHVRFAEEKPNVDALAQFLWKQSVNYALSRKRRKQFKEQLLKSDSADLSVTVDIMQIVRNVFLEFNKLHPHRASEVGEVLAYCIAIRYLNAAQLAAKMSLKTSSNMPVHGLDGIHAVVDNDALTVYFLESKLSSSANDGVADYADSAGKFLTDQKQYLHEYSLVGDLGNLDTLTGEARSLALQHFDAIAKPEISRRERSIGVVCYSETKHFSNTIPVSDGAVTAHQVHFSNNFSGELSHHFGSALKHLEKQNVDPNKCRVFFVAVPDVNVLRKKFYEVMGK